jgi:polyribonucleotide nucleotidyltransferase
MPQVFETLLGDRTLSIETGKLANQADGAVTLRYGDTVALVTACVSDKPREGGDFLPLTVDYEERHYAAGKIPGSFIRRESRPSLDAILADRLCDRSLRPLFPKSFRNDIQIIITVLSTDQENDPDILAITGASAALVISQIPFDGPVAAVRVGCIDGELVLNPTFSQLTESTLDIVVAGTADALVMIESDAKEVDNELILKALKFGQEAIQEIIELQQQLIQACGKPKMEFNPPEAGPEVEQEVSAILGDRLKEVAFKQKEERVVAMAAIEEELNGKLEGKFEPQQVGSVLDSLLKQVVRSQILDHNTRVAGRGLNEVRPITCEVGLLPRTHGSGLFTRGGTQILTTTTLGPGRKEQLIDTISPEETKRFLHHYNFPPYSVGETRRIVGPGRREIGHGALAERALTPVIPTEEDFPYTIRLVSEALSSNGSTSMGSICASSLSLMDAGVPIVKPVAGVAMGVIAEGNKYVLLTDIEGLEDAYGNMDFKVAGTADGITALQMDIKLKGIPYEVIEQALGQAQEARLFILDKMNQTISASRPELNKYAPRMYKISIDPDKIGTVIGPGGKTIRSIQEETKTTLDVDNDGTVIIGSVDEEGAQKAIKRIEELTKDVEVGAIYTGRVTRIINIGAFVEILPGKEGMVHISELADHRVPSVEDEVKVGDEIMVKVTEIDRMGRVNLSRRAVFQDSKGDGGDRGSAPSGQSRRPQGSRPPRGDRDRRSGGGPPRRYPDRGRKPINR